MSALSVLYGIMSVIVIVLAKHGHDRRSDDASRPTFAVLVFFGWFATELSRMMGIIQAWPAMDAILAGLMAFSFMHRPRAWKMLIMATLIMQCIGHVVFRTIDDGSREAFMVYASTNNAIFVIQLVTLGYDGGRKAWDDVRARLSDHMHRSGVFRFRELCKAALRKEGIGGSENVDP